METLICQSESGETRMKWLSNTLIAALIALVLTVLVALLPFTFFEGLEAQAGDEMMKLCYDLHQKYKPLPPDSQLVLAAIDEDSVSALGRWPFPRSVHGQFLDVLSPEKPKLIGWDIFFTEPTQTNPTDAPVAPAPDTATPPPSAPPAANPNAPDHTGAGVDQSPSTAPAAPDASTGAPAAPATSDAPAPTTETINSEDQALADSAALFTNMVMASYRDDEAPQLKETEIVPPTQPLKNITGDITRLLSAKSAVLPIPVLRKKIVFWLCRMKTPRAVSGARCR